MATIFQAEAALTDQYQTTVPAPIRKALKLEKRDRISFEIESDGSVLLRKAKAAEHRDPLLDGLLSLLAKDIQDRPSRIRRMSDDFRNEVQKLVKGVDTGDVNAPLPDDE